MKPRAKHIPRRPQDEPFYTNPTGLDFEKRRLVMAAKTITANMIADGALDYGLSFYAEVTTYTDTTHFKAAGLTAKGAGFFIPAAGAPYEIYVVQADAAAPEGQMTPVVAYTTADGTFQHAAFSGGNLAVGDIVLVLHPLIASLGTKATAAATGAVTTTDLLMAYIKQLITNTYRLAEAADGTGVYPASVAEDSLIAKILSRADPAVASSYDNRHDSLEAISDYIFEQHQHSLILFVIPEAVGSISADNTAIRTELDKMGSVHTITQTDALDAPDFTIYKLCVLGSNSDTAWATANLADIKTVPMLPVLCFDKVAAAYLEIGTDGGDAAAKTAIDVLATVEASLLGKSSTGRFTKTGLDPGANTISSSATYHTLDMSDADITEKVYATETEDVDGASANTDVIIGLIPGVLEDGSIGIDEAGEEIPATLAFFGSGYEAAKLTATGLGVIFSIVHILLHAQTAPAEVAGTIANLRRLLIGNMGGEFGNTTPVVEWLVGQNTAGTKLPAGTSLYDTIVSLTTDYLGHATHGLAALETLVDSLETWLGNPSGDTLTTITAKIGDIARSLDLIIGARWDASGDIGTDIAQLLTYCDILDNATNGLANIKSLIDTLTTNVGTVDTVVDGIQTDLSNATDGLGALKTLIDGVKTVADAIQAVTDNLPDGGALTTLQAAVDAIPTTMVGTNNAALASVLEDAMQKATTPAYNQDTDSQEAIREAIDAIKTILDTPANFMANLSTLETRLSAVRAGYLDQLDFALQEAIAAIPTTAMRGTDSAALASAWTAALATALGNYNATRAGYLDELAAANLPTDVAALNTLLSHGTYGLSALETLVDEVESLLKNATYGLSALKDLIDAISAGYTHSDWKGNFNWDTSAYTTVEQDISALFSTNLAIATRRKYSVKLDLTAVEADGSFDELYLAVKEKIDGTNYRAIDRKTVTKANLAVAAEPGIIIDIPATSENIQITIQMKTALAGDVAIYYSVVKEALE